MFLNRFMIKIIKKYQSNKSRQPRCRHIPSCSTYSLGCYQKFNFVKASLLTTYRIIRCNPLSSNIYDPIPLSKEEKKIRRHFDTLASKIDNELINIYTNNNRNDIINAIQYIWKTHFKSDSKIDFNNVSSDDLMLFYAKIDRLIYLAKKKKIPFKQKFVKKYIYQYLSTDISIYPK